MNTEQTPAVPMPDVEAILRQCMANTPDDHPDKESIERRLADPSPILGTVSITSATEARP